MSADPLTISLSDPLKTFVLEQAAAKGFPEPVDYVSALIDAERRRKVVSELETLLVEGLDSGPSIEANDAYWRETRRELGLQAGSTQPSMTLVSNWPKCPNWAEEADSMRRGF